MATVQWLQDYEEGLQRAGNENKPLFLDFFSGFSRTANGRRNQTSDDGLAQRDVDHEWSDRQIRKMSATVD